MRKAAAYASAKVAAVYAGTIMGAGFASGQELNQFFVVYGKMGLAGLGLAGGLFAWLGAYIMEIANRHQTSVYDQLLYQVCGRKLGRFLDLIVTLFLFCVLTIMLAGAGALFQDTLQLPFLMGLAVMSITLMLSSLKGLKGIALVNFILTPTLAITTVSVVLYSLLHHQQENIMLSLAYSTPQEPPPSHWLLSALLYLSYNLIMSLTVLAPLGAHTAQRSVRLAGGILGGFLLTFLAGLVSIVVMLHYPHILSHEIPMLYIASIQHDLLESAYLLIFATAMFTTALAALFGCAGKLQATTKLSFYHAALLVLALALAFSQIGFAHLIGILFPIFGYATLVFTLRLFYLSLFSR